MRRLFYPGELTPEIRITGGDAHHLARVMRAQLGDVHVVAGADGRAARMTVTAVARDAVTLQLDSYVEDDAPARAEVILVQALLKGEKTDFVVQKAVELGAKRIVPLRTARSEALPADERLSRKLAHWQGIVVASAMQCGRATLPQVEAVRDFADILGDAPGLRWIFSPHDAPAASGQAAEAVSVLIGPEGGFAPHEVTAAVNAGWLPQSLGPRVLRADTAATVALAWAQAVFGDLSREAVC